MPSSRLTKTLLYLTLALGAVGLGGTALMSALVSVHAGTVLGVCSIVALMFVLGVTLVAIAAQEPPDSE